MVPPAVVQCMRTQPSAATTFAAAGADAGKESPGADVGQPRGNSLCDVCLLKLECEKQRGLAAAPRELAPLAEGVDLSTANHPVRRKQAP